MKNLEKVVVNCLQITTINTFAKDLEMTVAVVNGLRITTINTHYTTIHRTC